MPERTAVIGGGFAGLAAANRLASYGNCEITIFDTIPVQPLDKQPPPVEHPVREGAKDRDSLLKPESQYRRLGGRSLYYQGVLLPIEAEALAAWPTSWRTRLTGPQGMYQQIITELSPDFPNLQERELPKQLHSLGLKHTPQALQIGPEGQARAYTPLVQTLGYVATGQITLRSGQVQRLERETSGQWSVHFNSKSQKDTARGFDTCILAASAVGNAVLLARSLDQTLQLPITDHISLGAYAKVITDQPPRVQHPKLWSGYRTTATSNLFLHESRAPHPPYRGNQQLLDVNAILESDHSFGIPGKLIVSPGRRPKVFNNGNRTDKHNIDQTQDEILEFLSKYCGSQVSLALYGGFSYYSQAAFLAEGLNDKEALLYTFPWGTFQHEAQTTPMGWDTPELSITDELEVAQMPGVYVAGPGTFPRLGKANPTLTIIATSRLLADMIASA